jgi:hypothetical protein
MASKLNMKHRHRGEKAAQKLLKRIERAEARGDWHEAQSLRRLFSRSHSIKLGMLVEEIARQNGRRRPPVAVRGGSQINCNALQRALTGKTWIERRDLRRSEVLIPKFVDEELIEGDIVDVRSAVSGGRRHRPFTNKQARQKAATIHLDRAPESRFTVMAKRKADGSFRPIHAFGVVDRVRQRLLLAAYGSKLSTAPNIFSAKGNGGRPAAIAAVRRAIENGAKWAAVIDIKNYFGTMNRTWLRENLPVPRQFVRSTILMEDATEPAGRFMRDGTGIARTRAQLVMDDQTSANDLIGIMFKSQAGAPQGAATSAAVATHLMSEVLKVIKLPNGVFLIIYADDIAVLGARKSDVERAMLTLGEAFSSHPGGPYELHKQQMRRVSDGFAFLGMQFRRRRDVVECMPTDDALKRARARLLKAVLNVVETEQPVALERSMAGILASFAAWRWRSNWLFYFLGQLRRRHPWLRCPTSALYLRFRAAAQVELFSA